MAAALSRVTQTFLGKIWQVPLCSISSSLSLCPKPPPSPYCHHASPGSGQSGHPLSQRDFPAPWLPLCRALSSSSSTVSRCLQISPAPSSQQAAHAWSDSPLGLELALMRPQTDPFTRPRITLKVLSSPKIQKYFLFPRVWFCQLPGASGFCSKLL